MRVLIVSPQSDIQADSELIAAAGENRPTVLNGIVTTREVIGRIASGDFDAVHFAVHGNQNALEMSDGVLDDLQLQQAFEAASRNGSPVGVVVLNACRSIGPALRIYSSTKGGPSFVVAWRHDVGDDEARFFAVRFWRSLSLSPDAVRDAYEDAKDAFLRRFPDAEPPLLLNGIKAMLDELARQVAMQTDTIRELRNPPRDMLDKILPLSLFAMTVAIVVLSFYVLQGGG